ncbi:HAMP domain-containing sensor histidine kinase [uncultured Clostridium sp.]|uniref:HAMP domain-containing sensor histidine kinase n=1 Tax=uncultured Clostridium sp. TaxID=59620 RepID=UPI003217D11D
MSLRWELHMNIKRIVVISIIVLLTCTSLTFFAFNYKGKTEIEVPKVNDIAQSLAKEWDSLEYAELPCLSYKIDYVVLDNENRFIKATRSGLNNDLSSAIRNRDTIVDVKSQDKVLGKVIIYNNTNNEWIKFRNLLLIFTLCVIIVAAVFCSLYFVFIDRCILYPFRKLQGFARHVAEGNLDMPLDMDKNNFFGAFTESFDLMREELNKARENERLANQSKKELVASLSHDIKTPVASIKAVTEVMHVKTSDENQRRQLDIINSKADQINTLITNMFSATLEELQELKVIVTEQSSQVLYDLIRAADYNCKANIGGIAECIILADGLRLSQVVDNIISNSYKYAGTSIYVSSVIKGKYLEIGFKDYGRGVSEEELPLIFNKFYRAKNSKEKGGTGLGLYISKYMMEKMEGDIYCENSVDGFTVLLKLLIA